MVFVLVTVSAPVFFFSGIDRTTSHALGSSLVEMYSPVWFASDCRRMCGYPSAGICLPPKLELTQLVHQIMQSR